MTVKQIMDPYTQQFDIERFSENNNLLSREQGQMIFEEIKKDLNKLPKGGILVLDFLNIRYATPACLAEILRAIGYSERKDFQDTYLTLKLGSANRDLKQSFFLLLKETKHGVLSLDEKGNWEVIGQLTKAQRDTFAIVMERKEVTSGDLCWLLNIPMNAASNRLKSLYNMRLLRREERVLPHTGGRKFIYRSLIP